MLVLTVCACTSVPKGCTIEGTVKDKSYEGKQVYLRHALTPETYDSTIVKNGTFRFTLGETSPEVSLLVLKASSDDLFPVTLPVVTEKGVVKVVLGELVLTSGTDLNDRLQDFLLAVRPGSVTRWPGKGKATGKSKRISPFCWNPPFSRTRTTKWESISSAATARVCPPNRKHISQSGRVNGSASGWMKQITN